MTELVRAYRKDFYDLNKEQIYKGFQERWKVALAFAFLVYLPLGIWAFAPEGHLVIKLSINVLCAFLVCRLLDSYLITPEEKRKEHIESVRNFLMENNTHHNNNIFTNEWYNAIIRDLDLEIADNSILNEIKKRAIVFSKVMVIPTISYIAYLYSDAFKAVPIISTVIFAGEMLLFSLVAGAAGMLVIDVVKTLVDRDHSAAIALKRDLITMQWKMNNDAK